MTSSVGGFTARVKELNQRKAELFGAQESVLNAATEAKRSLTAAQERTGWGLNSLEHQCLRGRHARFSRITPQKSVFRLFDPLYMGRIPVPTEMLDAKGSFIKHPERRRPNEPQETGPLGNSPKYLTAEEKKLWGEIARNMPPGVGKVSDRYAFEMLVRLMAKERADAINNNERGQLIKLLGSFGMTPADRSKISIESPPLNRPQRFLTRSKPISATPAVSDERSDASVQ